MSAFSKKTIKDVDLNAKTVILRPEFNVPIKDGIIKDDYRITTSLPTLRYLLEHNCKVIIICTLGRPKGQVVNDLSQEPVAKHLGSLIENEVSFVDALYGEEVKRAVENMPLGSVLMLQNMRFDPGEEANDRELARNIAESVNADYMVFNAFGNSHRKHASQVAITEFVPAVSGLLVESEVAAITSAIQNPEHPVVAVVGGAKIETKLKLLNNFIQISEHIVIGGAMANTFLKAQGYEVGDSVYEEGEIDSALSVIKAAEVAGVNLFIPSAGVAVGNSFKEPGPRREVQLSAIAKGDVILDFSKESIDEMLKFVAEAKTIIWNGPLGVTEYKDFAVGSKALADFIVQNKIYAIVGGGDTAGFVNEIGYGEDIAHISTGGGASLELMAGNKLPGVEALLDA